MELMILSLLYMTLASWHVPFFGVDDDNGSHVIDALHDIGKLTCAIFSALMLLLLYMTLASWHVPFVRWLMFIFLNSAAHWFRSDIRSIEL